MRGADALHDDFSLDSLVKIIETFQAAGIGMPGFWWSMFLEGERLEVIDGDTVKWANSRYTRRLGPSTQPDSKAVGVSDQDTEFFYTGLNACILSTSFSIKKLKTQLRDPARRRREIARRLKNMLIRAYLNLEYISHGCLTPAGAVVNPTTVPGSTRSFTHRFTGVTDNAIAAAETIMDPATEFLSGTYAGSLHDVQETMDSSAGFGDTPDTFISRRKFYRGARGNTQMQAWLRGTGRASEIVDDPSVLQAFSGMGGIRDWRSENSFYETETGGQGQKTRTTNRFFDENDGLFLPAGPERYLGYALGDAVIPEGSIGYDEQSIEALGRLNEGLTFYAYMSEKQPAEILMVVEINAIPVVTDDKAPIYVTDIAADAST